MIRKVALFIVTVLVCLGALEWASSHFNNTRWQAVEQYEIVDGVPVFEPSNVNKAGHLNEGCLTDEGADVLLVGDSIFYGILLKPEDTLAPALSQRLRRPDGSAACVVNLSVPGFTLQQEAAVLKRSLTRYTPRVVVLEIWHNSPHIYREVGSILYNFGSLSVDHGVPNPLKLSGTFNRSLFEQSRLWRKVVELMASQYRQGATAALWADLLRELDQLRVALIEQDVQLVLAFATPLSTPWRPGEDKRGTAFAEVAQWGERHRISMVRFEDLMGHRPVEDVRLDTCCHLNAEGTFLLADGLTSVLQPMIADAPTPLDRTTEAPSVAPSANP